MHTLKSTWERHVLTCLIGPTLDGFKGFEDFLK